MNITTLLSILSLFSQNLTPGGDGGDAGNGDATIKKTLRASKVLANLVIPSSDYQWIDQLKIYGTSPNDEDCRGELGCFPLTTPWYGPERPIALQPDQIQDIDPTFCFYQTSNGTCQEIDVSNEGSISDLPINSHSFVTFVTHGFFVSSDRPWVKEMVDALLIPAATDLNSLSNSTLLQLLFNKTNTIILKEKLPAKVTTEQKLRAKDGNFIKNRVNILRNVVVLDWRRGSEPPYAQAVANTRIVGASVGSLIRKLMKEKGVQAENIHLIGHSLGAHIFGYAGQYLREKRWMRQEVREKDEENTIIGKITGLDPAGPYFWNLPREVRLDKTDANTVNIIHTDGGNPNAAVPEGMGILESIGHFDFYPDGGKEQRGCEKSAQEIILSFEDVSEGLMEAISCSHEMAHKYYIAALNPSCEMIGIKCNSWDSFRRGECWDCEKKKENCFRMVSLQLFSFANLPDEDDVINDVTNDVIPKSDLDLQMLNGTKLDRKFFMVTPNDGSICGNQIRITIDVGYSSGDFGSFSITLRGLYGTAFTSQYGGASLLDKGKKVVWVDGIPNILPIQTVLVQYKEEKNFLNFLWPWKKLMVILDQVTVEILEENLRLKFLKGEKKLYSESVVLLKPINIEKIEN